MQRMRFRLGDAELMTAFVSAFFTDAISSRRSPAVSRSHQKVAGPCGEEFDIRPHGPASENAGANKEKRPARRLLTKGRRGVSYPPRGFTADPTCPTRRPQTSERERTPREQFLDHHADCTLAKPTERSSTTCLTGIAGSGSAPARTRRQLVRSTAVPRAL
jgi:hypothetical protein